MRLASTASASVTESLNDERNPSPRDSRAITCRTRRLHAQTENVDLFIWSGSGHRSIVSDKIEGRFQDITTKTITQVRYYNIVRCEVPPFPTTLFLNMSLVLVFHGDRPTLHTNCNTSDRMGVVI